jgi:hypothetical protein
MYLGYLTNVSVGASSPYIFTTKYITNSNISYNSTTGLFTFRTPGWYKVSFNTSAGGTGNIIPTLYKSGVASTYELAAMTSTGNTNLVNGAFETIIYVAPSTPNNFATLQVINAGVAALTTSATISIERIG